LEKQVDELKRKNTMWAEKFMEEVIAKDMAVQERGFALLDTQAVMYEAEEAMAESKVINGLQDQEPGVLWEELRDRREEVLCQQEELMVAYGQAESDRRNTAELVKGNMLAAQALAKTKRLLASRERALLVLSASRAETTSMTTGSSKRAHMIPEGNGAAKRSR
jgi:hypothetical protein